MTDILLHTYISSMIKYDFHISQSQDAEACIEAAELVAPTSQGRVRVFWQHRYACRSSFCQHHVGEFGQLCAKSAA